jgi:hypothetical protein
VKLIKINLPYFVSTVQANIGAQESFVHKVSLWWGQPFEKNSDVESSKGVENPCVGGSIPPRATKI